MRSSDRPASKWTYSQPKNSAAVHYSAGAIFWWQHAISAISKMNHQHSLVRFTSFGVWCFWFTSIICMPFCSAIKTSNLNLKSSEMPRRKCAKKVWATSNNHTMALRLEIQKSVNQTQRNGIAFKRFWMEMIEWFGNKSRTHTWDAKKCANVVLAPNRKRARFSVLFPRNHTM